MHRWYHLFFQHLIRYLRRPMSRELRYGLIAGFITMIWMTAGYALGWDQNEWSAFINIIILGVAIYITILHKRDRDRDGLISVKDSFIAGMSVSFMTGILVGAYLVIYSTWVNPDFVNQSVQQAKDYYQAEHATQAQIDQAVEGIRAKYSVFGQITFGIGASMIPGALMSLVCAAIMRREKKSDVRN